MTSFTVDLSLWKVNALDGKVRGSDKEGTFGSVKVLGIVVSGSRGNDITGNGTDTTPYKTIGKATSLAVAGDTISVEAGTYTEDSGTNFYNTAIGSCVSFTNEGTSGNLITLQSRDGAEGDVIIDGNTHFNSSSGEMDAIDGAKPANMGINIGSKNYIRILDLVVKNCNIIGIGADSVLDSGIFNPSTTVRSDGCVIESNLIEEVGGDTFGGAGPNVDAIRFTKTNSWTIKNNRIRKVRIDGVIGGTHCSGMQTYRAKDSIIENNYITDVDVGIAFKSHWYEDNLAAAITCSESRFNISVANSVSLYVFDGNVTTGGGIYNIHHNIFKATTGTATLAAVVRINVSDLNQAADDFTFDHNVIDNNGATKQMMDIRGYTDLKMSGNIFRGTGFIANIKGDGAHPGTVTLSDYNVSATDGTYDFRITVDVNLGTAASFTTLAAWRAATSATYTTLNTDDTHDDNSVVSAYVDEFTAPSTNDYTLKVGASGLGLMGDSSDAGVYQAGTEVIGLTGWVASA